jgi:hypothetical protein
MGSIGGGINWPLGPGIILARVGRIGRGGAVGGGTLRFRVDVCNRPLSRYGAENQTISNRPNGNIEPGVYAAGNTEFEVASPSFDSG